MLDFLDESDYTYIKQWLKEATGRRDIAREKGAKI